MAGPLSHSYPQDRRRAGADGCFHPRSRSNPITYADQYQHILRLWIAAASKPLLVLPDIRFSVAHIEDFRRTYFMLFLVPQNVTLRDPYLRPERLHCTLLFVDTIIPHEVCTDIQHALRCLLLSFTNGVAFWADLTRITDSWQSWNFGASGKLLRLILLLQRSLDEILREQQFYTIHRPLHISWA